MCDGHASNNPLCSAKCRQVERAGRTHIPDTSCRRASRSPTGFVIRSQSISRMSQYPRPSQPTISLIGLHNLTRRQPITRSRNRRRHP